MNPLKKALTYCLLNSLLAVATVRVHADQSQGGPYTITRSVVGAPGGAYLAGGNAYTAGLAVGEPVAGIQMTVSNTVHVSGYYAGWVGNGRDFALAGSQIPATGPRLTNVQVGVALQTRLEMDFSDQLDPTTVTPGIIMAQIQDNMGHPQSALSPVQLTYQPTGMTIYINPQGNWFGNTIYDLYVSTSLRNLDGSPLQNPTHLRFLTVLDPQQPNIVMQPVDANVQPQIAPAPAVGAAGPITLQISPKALADYSTVLVNSDPLTSPARINPQIILDANKTAASTGGSYMVPFAIQEINAYSLSNQVTNTLSQPAQLSLPYAQAGTLSLGTPGPVRSGTLTLWALDETHHLWVKIPDSQNNSPSATASATITRFGVFALMGQASGDAQSTFVFPTPWRPNGPNAGSGPGQTGTLDGGLTFSNLPSECTIKIYTVAGELVRSLQHSDTSGSIGQEKWDGCTTHGQHAASGVYLWRVESSVDAKTGKLMIIR